MKLFIIGNGFDLQHGLKTHYSDFLKFNKKSDNGKHFIYSLDKFQYCPQEDLWSNFEINLGELSDDIILEETEYRKNEFNNEFNYGPLDNSFITSHFLEEYYSPLMFLDNLVLNWIKSIDITKIESNSCIHEYQKIFMRNPDALFISFNYTRLLEDLYNINENQILHIHGSIDDIPIMGHGKDNLQNSDINISSTDKEFIRDIHGGFCAFYNSSRKDISKFNETLISFIKSHNESKFEKIIVIGHSLGKVDIPYFKTLNKIIPNVDWKITYFGDNDLKMKRHTLRELNLNRFQLVQSIIKNSSIT